MVSATVFSVDVIDFLVLAQQESTYFILLSKLLLTFVHRQQKFMRSY